MKIWDFIVSFVIFVRLNFIIGNFNTVFQILTPILSFSVGWFWCQKFSLLKLVIIYAYLRKIFMESFNDGEHIIFGGSRLIAFGNDTKTLLPFFVAWVISVSANCFACVVVNTNVIMLTRYQFFLYWKVYFRNFAKLFAFLIPFLFAVYYQQLAPR